ncbi:MAG: VCBS repeat-containing protein [Planctomycetota bacterium]
MFRLLSLGAFVGLLAPQLSAQFGNEWVELTDNAGSLGLDALDLSGLNNEVDFAWADLDQDGWTDLVVVRKEPFSTIGKRTNLLLMNEGGLLVDRTRDYARAADIEGDEGFLTPTNDRDVALADVDQDGWLDVVTAPTLSFDDPKHLGHPRVYMNLGADGGAWNGLEYQDARFPQLFQFTTGLPENPVFCALAAGDVTDDGYPDLYFSDYDISNEGVFGGPLQDPLEDLDDRLLINDGAGYFADQSQLRMTETMLLSRFGTDCKIADINGDGYNDVLKETSLGVPYYAAAVYNNPADPGMFNIFDDFHTFSPYHIGVGDLNNDGRLDVAFADDNPDRYRYNLGNDPLGRVIWGPAKTYEFLSGGDDGFGGNNLIVDLDHDGWNDVLQADIDPDDSSVTRRLHIYHNPGGAVGEEITLREERELDGDGGWIGAVGFEEDDLKAVHDMAFFDLDQDGDDDLILGRAFGTHVWLNQVVPNHLYSDVGTISQSGGGTQTLSLDAGSEHAGSLYLVLGSLSGTSPGTPIGGGTIPLNVDPYFLFTANHPNTDPLTSSFGNLDGDGRATAQFALAAGATTQLAGQVVNHAFGVLDPVTFALELVSEPVGLLITP